LGSAPEYTQQIKLGTLAMGLVTSGQMQEYVKQYGIIEAPFLFSSLQQAHKGLDGPAGDQLAALAKQQGFIILSNWEWGFRQITNSVRPIQEPADMKGLKMRVPSEFQIQDMMKALGASTDTIAFPELYTALAQKVVDGQDNPVQTIFDQHFYEVQKYLAITNHAYNTQMLVMSQHAWNSLSAQEQQVFMNASKRAGDLVRNLDEQQQSSEITQMQQTGMVVTHPDLAAFRKAVQPADQQVYDYVGDAFAQKFVAEVEAAAGQ
ncbi:MAG: DctP family TRAP transporter solute-binding subunit, partial [Deinococcales bacterium]